MKAKKEDKEKTFDAVKFMREQRYRMSKDIMDLSPEEIVDYFKKNTKESGIPKPIQYDLKGEPVTLTDEQKDFIDKGLRDIEEGKLISNEEVKLRSKEWLKNR